jgi:outer membrane receptor protein involved in Fe transport
LFKVLFKDPVVADTSVVIKDIGLTTNFYRGMLEYQYVPNTRLENKLKLSFGRDQNAFNLGQAIKTTTDLYQLQARDAARYVFNDMLALRGGVDYLYQRRNVEATVPRLVAEGGGGSGQPSLSDTQSAKTSDTYHSIAGFAELEFKPWQGMLAVPGVRFDYFGRTKKTALSPRLTLRQAINPEWTLKAGVGLFQQEPTFAETDKAGGNPKLGTEKALHYSAGFEFTPKPFLNLSVTGFYKTLYDTVGATDAVTSVNGETVPVNYNNEAKGRAMGLEVSARHELHENLFAWVAYTLSKSERKDPGSTSYRLFDYDQTHILTVMGSYRLPRNWEIGARFRYVTGNLYTPVTGAVYDADKDEYASSTGKLNSSRVQGFHQLDIRIDKRWVYQSWMLNAYLDIQNVYNQVNVENLDYNYDFSKSLPQQGLPLVPVLGLRGEF